MNTNLIEIYKEIINNIARLLKELDFNNPAQVFALYNYLLKNNLISLVPYENNKNIEIERQNIDNNFLGINVICSYYSCRHISNLLREILKAINKTAYDIITFIPPLKIDSDHNESMEKSLKTIAKCSYTKEMYESYLEEIKAYSKPFKIVKDNRRKLTGNHTILLVLENEFSYFYDPTHNTFLSYNKLQHNLTSEFGFKSKIITYFFPEATNLSLKQMLLLIKEIHATFKSMPLANPNTKQLFAEANLTCQANNSLLKDFNLKNMPLFKSLEQEAKIILERKK